MLQKIWGGLILLLCPMLVVAQQLPTGQNYYDGQKGIVYSKEFTIDGKLQSRGFAVGLNFAKLKTYYLTSYINFELAELKHIREFRRNFDFQAPVSNRVARAFIFGKQNNFYALRVGFGQKRYLSGKARRKGVAIGLSYQAGPSLGLLKPYYLEIKQPVDGDLSNFTIRSQKYSEENADLFLNEFSIYGATGLAKGWGELGVRPGAHGKLAVHIDWGAFDEFVKAIEAGIMIDAYLTDIPIMVEDPRVPNVKNSPLFLNFFVSVQLGKRR